MFPMVAFVLLVRCKLSCDSSGQTVAKVRETNTRIHVHAVECWVMGQTIWTRERAEYRCQHRAASPDLNFRVADDPTSAGPPASLLRLGQNNRPMFRK